MTKLPIDNIGVRHIERIFGILDLPNSNRPDVQQVLANLHVGQQMASIAKKHVDAAKKELKEQFDIPEEQGEHEIVAIHPFDLTVKVTSPKKSFDLDLFMTKLNEEFDIPKSRLTEIAGNCNKFSKAPQSFKTTLIK